MITFDAVFGEGRLGDWFRDDPFSSRGRYEQKDAVGTAGRLADWVEASCLFVDEAPVSRTDVYDEIKDAGVVSDDNDDELVAASEAVFAELHRRRQLLIASDDPEAYPFELGSDVIRRRESSWHDTPVYSFLLCASVAQNRGDIITSGSSYDEVGHLFESVAAHAYSGFFGDAAHVLPVRRGRPSAEQHIAVRLGPILDRLGVTPLPAFEKAPQRVNDGGLDLVCRFQIGDSRPGGSFVLVQCATGLDWLGKVATPNEDTWRAWVDWRGPIWRSFCVPFVFKDDDTLRDASRGGGWQLILDRLRLSRGSHTAGELAEPVASSVIAWLEGRMPLLSQVA